MTPKIKCLALAGLGLSLGLAAACSNGSDGMMNGGQGRVEFVMSAAAPATATATTLGDSSTESGLKAARVTFASILARNLDGELVDVTIDLPVTVDLLGLVSNGSFTLPAGYLPPGTYDQLVIVMTKVELTLQNDTVVTIDPPGGGWTAIVRVTEPFTVVEGLTTTVTVRFRIERLFEWLEDRWEFHPEFECDGDSDGHDD